METFIKRITMMSAALILLCVTAVAQNEKSSKSVRSESYGVSIQRTDIELTPGQVDRVEVTVMDGFDDPFLTYKNISKKTVVGDIL